MGRIAIAIGFARRVLGNGAQVAEVTADPGGGANVTAVQMGPPGDDSPPLSGDSGYIGSIPGQGAFAVLGFTDTKNAGVAERGEKRLYSRDASGAPVAAVWLKSDGSILITNSSGSFLMAASGDVIINGVTIKANGDIDAPGLIEAPTIEAATSLKVLSKELNAHVHPGVTVGPGSTGPF